MKTVIIVDFSHFFYMTWFQPQAAGPYFDAYKAACVNAEGKIRTTLRHLDKLSLTDRELVFVEDRGAVRKISIDPNYRNNRGVNHTEDKLRLKGYVRSLPTPSRFCYSDGNEADDTMASLARILRTRDDKMFAVLVTGDRDLWQLMGPTTAVFNLAKKIMVTREHVQQAFRGVGPEHVALIKALWGDYGDNVPNALPRTQKELIPLVLASDGSLKDFQDIVEAYWPRLSERTQRKYRAGQFRLGVNWELVKLDEYCPLIWE